MGTFSEAICKHRILFPSIFSVIAPGAWRRPQQKQKCGKNSNFWTYASYNSELLKIDRYMLRGVWQALNCLSIHGTYCVIVSHRGKNVSSTWKRRFFALAAQTSCAARWPPQYAPAPADRRPISGQFVVRGQELPMAYVCAKFEDRSFTRLRNIKVSQNFEIGSRAAGDAQFRANLWSGGKNCPRPMCMPNLKGVALSVCEILAHFTAVH